METEYVLPAKVLAKYHCSQCKVSGVKLWRNYDSRRWCSNCGTAQANLPNDIDNEGCRNSNYGKSDQIYNPDCGLNLLPCVPDIDGTTWGYMFVPPEAVKWWRNLPTKETR